MLVNNVFILPFFFNFIKKKGNMYIIRKKDVTSRGKVLFC